MGRDPTKRRSGRPAHREWIGGRLPPPFFTEDRDTPAPVDLFVWLEMPSDRIVGQEVAHRDQSAGTLGHALGQALDAATERPDAIRVSDPAFVDEVREVVEASIPITVGPTPELDAVLDDLLEALLEHEHGSYFEGGRIGPDAIAELFRSAEQLYDAAPWTVATDDQLVRVDIPTLGVRGACMSIIGHLGESLGFILFPSRQGYEAFVDASRRGIHERYEGPASQPPNMGTEWLSLSYGPASELPPTMRREVLEHGWPVAGIDAIPSLVASDPNGAPHPLGEDDVKIVSACAECLAMLFLRHPNVFDRHPSAGHRNTYRGQDGTEVRLTFPYDATGMLPDTDDPPRRPSRRISHQRPKVGRNQPCPCGSGRKYKKCCLRRERIRDAQAAASPAPEARAAPHAYHDRHQDLIGALIAYAHSRFGQEWADFAKDFTVTEEELIAFSIPWSLFHRRIQGGTVAEWFLDERATQLAPEERDWLATEMASWISVWEVTAVDPGASITLRDLLSGETRHVLERSASTTLSLRDAILGRVIDTGGVSLLSGLHPYPLRPLDAAEVVERARRRLRRRTAVPIERLRDDRFTRFLIARWEETALASRKRMQTPPELQNTSGHPLLFTKDHYTFDDGARAEVEERLAALEDVERKPTENLTTLVFFASIEQPDGASEMEIVVGHAHLSGSRLTLETNSVERADALRARVETVCGTRIHHRSREHSDPLSEESRAAAAAPTRSEPPQPALPQAEMDEIARQFKERHYAEWPDAPLPALGGATPREAAKTARGRIRVDALIKDMENHEHRAYGPDGAFDFTPLRRELGLE